MEDSTSINMKHFSRFSCWLVVLASVALLTGGVTGCRTVEVAEGTIGEFRLGELQTMNETNFQTAYEAAKDAIARQGLFLTGDDRKVVEAVLTARDRADAQVTVKIKEVSPNQTSVRIRYGLTGDEARSQILYREIAKRF